MEEETGTEIEKRVGGERGTENRGRVRGEREREPERSRKPEGGFYFILFHVPISRLVSSQTLAPPGPSSPPPRSL